MLRLAFVFLLVSGFLIAAPIVLFNDFGPGSTFLPGPGITVGCGALCFLDAGHSHGWSFTPSTTTTLSLLETAASGGPGPAATIVFTISSDAGGLPGSTLESFSVPVSQPLPQFVSFTSTLHPTLLAGHTYWFTASTQDLLNQAANVGINSIGLTGPEALEVGNGPWAPTFSSGYAVFRVTGDAAQVPEPSTLCLLGLGAMAIAARRRIAHR